MTTLHLDHEVAPPTVALRPIGSGSFGTFMRQLISTSIPSRMLSFLPSYTRSSSLDWEQDVLRTNAVNAVYVASPDAYHQEHAAACLKHGKHVLVEKPVTPNFMVLLEALQTNNHSQALVVGFQRRFAHEFVRAKQEIDGQPSLPKEILIESFDPVGAVENMPFVVNNSMCHDVDMLSWMLPCDDCTTELVWQEGTTDATTSSVHLVGEIKFKQGENESSIRVVINYKKCHSSYVQRVTIDGKCFGYNYTPKPNESECVVYNDAYIKQFLFFIHSIHKKNDYQIDGQSMNYESDLEERNRLDSYARSFKWLKEAHDVLF
jgi:hypothetical protein